MYGNTDNLSDALKIAAIYRESSMQRLDKLVPAKGASWHVRPSNSQISLRIWMDAQTDLPIRWADMATCSFGWTSAHIYICYKI